MAAHSLQNQDFSLFEMSAPSVREGQKISIRNSKLRNEDLYGKI
jgi:hypothetical protein